MKVYIGKTHNAFLRIIFLVYMISFFVMGYNEEFYQISNAISLLFFSGALIYISINKSWEIAMCKELLSMGLFMMYSLISLMWVSSLSDSVVRLRTVILLCLLLLAIYNSFCDTDSDFLVKSIWISGTCMLLVFFVVYGTEAIFSSIGDDFIRLGDVIGGINFVSGMTAIYIVVSFYYLLYEKNKWMLLSLAFGSIVIASTQSRSGLMFISSAILALFMEYRHAKGVRISSNTKLVLSATTISAVAYFVLNPSFTHRVFRRVFLLFDFISDPASQGDYSSYIRFGIMKYGLELFGNNPLTGYGIGSGYALFSGNYFHNNYIQILVETGLIGILLYYYAFYHAIKKCSLCIKNNIYCVVGLALLVGQVIRDITNSAYYKKEAFIILGIALCLCRKSKRNINIEAASCKAMRCISANQQSI